DSIKVRHSSGHNILDDAAIRIVRLAAPFSPFPNEIRKETDILDITRTWQFLRSGRFDSQ
ncbi:MAG: TonB family protein, partial [Candidatus Thiodiazotropha sp.]